MNRQAGSLYNERAYFDGDACAHCADWIKAGAQRRRDREREAAKRYA